MTDKAFDQKFQDPKTGETVIRVKVPENMLPELEKHIAVNSQSANNFMAVSRQIVALQRKQNEEYDKATEAEKIIGKTVVIVREKMKLDSSWIYNMPLKMMEKREPPNDPEFVNTSPLQMQQ